MAATDIEVLKFNLQERQYPYFTDLELEMLLSNNDLNVNKASWKGCILKAVADDGIDLGGSLKTSSNREYWLKLADNFEIEYKNESSNITSGRYKTRMSRVDSQ